jgi:hypothetical protein
MKNPIIDNRIVSGITFATRLKDFLEQVQVNDWASEEEQNYLLDVANQLLQYQKETITDSNEKQYFNNLSKIHKS